MIFVPSTTQHCQWGNSGECEGEGESERHLGLWGHRYVIQIPSLSVSTTCLLCLMFNLLLTSNVKVIRCQKSHGWRMGSHWLMMRGWRWCQTAGSFRSVDHRWLTQAGIAAWHQTVQETGADISTWTCWVCHKCVWCECVFCDPPWGYLTLFMFISPVSPTIAGSDPEGLAEEVTVTLNSPTSLICEAQSYPPAIITWLKDGTPFESSRNVRVLPGQISIFKVGWNWHQKHLPERFINLLQMSSVVRWPHFTDPECQRRGCWKIYLCGD